MWSIWQSGWRNRIMNEETRQILMQVSTATLTTQLLKRGFRNCFMSGVRALSEGGGRLVGPAYTVRYIPAREDLTTLEALGDPMHPQRKAVENAPPGSVVVSDCRGKRDVAGVGAILLARMKVRGVAGFVCDGGVRDLETARAVGLPLYGSGPAAPPNVTLHHAVETCAPIACGDVAVFNDDIIVGDVDGVVVLPAHLAEEVARDALEQEKLEDFIFERIRGGAPLIGTYPPNAETLKAYDDSK